MLQNEVLRALGQGGRCRGAPRLARARGAALAARLSDAGAGGPSSRARVALERALVRSADTSLTAAAFPSALAGMMGIGMGFGALLTIKGYLDMITGSNKKAV